MALSLRWSFGRAVFLLAATISLSPISTLAATTTYIPTRDGVFPLGAATNGVVTNIPLPQVSAAMALTPDGKFAYLITGSTKRDLPYGLSYAGRSASANASLASVSVHPNSVKSGASAAGTVKLSAAAPSGGMVIDLWTNGSPAFVPKSVTIPAGETSGTFPVTTNYVTSPSQGTITAFYKGTRKTTTITVTPVSANASLASVSVSPNSVKSGAPAKGTVTLSAPAPSSGMVIDLWTNGSPAFVPKSLTIPAGETNGTFPVTTDYVTSPSQGTITAFYKGTRKTTSITVTPGSPRVKH